MVFIPKTDFGLFITKVRTAIDLIESSDGYARKPIGVVGLVNCLTGEFGGTAGVSGKTGIATSLSGRGLKAVTPKNPDAQTESLSPRIN